MADLTAPTKDEFAAWQDHPVTRFVNAGLLRLATLAKAEWQADAWAGYIEPVPLARVKTRVEVYADLANLNLEDARGANGMEPEEAKDAQ